MATTGVTDRTNWPKPDGKTMPPGEIDREIRNNVVKVAEIEAAHKATRTTGGRLADVIAAFCGSMPFVYFHIAFFGIWIILNTASEATRFDPFPFFFLAFVISLELIFLSTFILISQNHERRLTERRNHLNLQINLLAEQENTKTLELLQLVAKKVGVDHDENANKALLEPVDPGRLVEQILRETGEIPDDADL